MRENEYYSLKAVRKAVIEFMREYELETFPTRELLQSRGRGMLYHRIKHLGGIGECAKQMEIPIEKQRMPRKKNTNSLCWSCKHAVPNPRKGNGCAWSIEFKPVQGWNADKKESCAGTSYFVYKCPEFRKG